MLGYETMIVRKADANHAGKIQSSGSEDSGESLTRTKLCTPLKTRKIKIRLNHATSNINENEKRGKQYDNVVSEDYTSKEKSSRLCTVYNSKYVESSGDPVFVTKDQVSRSKRRHSKSRSPSWSSDSPTRYKAKRKKKKSSRKRLVTTVDSLSGSSDSYGRYNKNDQNAISRPKSRHSYHSSKTCTTKRKEYARPEISSSKTYECSRPKQISMLNMDRLHNRRKNEDMNNVRSQTTRHSAAPFQPSKRNQKASTTDNDLWIEEVQFFMKKVRGSGSETSNISDSDKTKSSLDNSRYHTPEPISRNHDRGNSTENSRNSKELILLTEKVPTRNSYTELQKGLFKNSSFAKRQPSPSTSYDNTHDDDLEQIESDEYIATTPPSIEELNRVRRKSENIVQPNNSVNSHATTAHIASPVYEKDMDPSNEVVILEKGREKNTSNHSFKEPFEITYHMVSPVYEKELDPSNEVVILDDGRKTNVHKYSFKEPFESEPKTDELFDAYTFQYSGSAQEKPRVEDNSTYSQGAGNIKHKLFTTQPYSHSDSVSIDYDRKTLKTNVDNNFGTENREEQCNIIKLNGRKSSDCTQTRLPPLPPVINNTTQHLELLQLKAKTDTKNLHSREISEIKQSCLYSRKNSLKPKEGISSTAVDLIELSDDDVFKDNPRDPRLNASRNKPLSHNGSERSSSSYNLGIANVRHVWCKDLLNSIVNGSSFRPSQFGHVSDYFASQQMLLIPWTKVHYFQYNINNPCIVDDQSCKHYRTRQCRQCKAEYDGNTKMK